MYEPIAACKLPEDMESLIWRYMDISKLVCLLDKNLLYFARADLLGDPFEGSHTKTHHKSDYIIQIMQGDENKQEIKLTSAQMFSAFRRNTFINCWHLNPNESHAMWSVYLRDHQGIAIQSTCSRLITALSKNEQYKVNVGCVNYIDYEKDSFPDENQTIFGFLHKHKSYEHERELRAIIRAEHHASAIFAPDQVPVGKQLQVDLEVLIERIVLPPDAPSELEGVITSLLQLYGLAKPVTLSSIPRRPQWSNVD